MLGGWQTLPSGLEVYAEKRSYDGAKIASFRDSRRQMLATAAPETGLTFHRTVDPAVTTEIEDQWSAINV